MTQKSFTAASANALNTALNTYFGTTLAKGSYQLINIIFGYDATLMSSAPYYAIVYTAPTAGATAGINVNAPYMTVALGGFATTVGATLDTAVNSYLAEIPNNGYNSLWSFTVVDNGTDFYIFVVSIVNAISKIG